MSKSTVIVLCRFYKTDIVLYPSPHYENFERFALKQTCVISASNVRGGD